ncbi:MAG: tRNA uridine-5-carboxymethylaminomethyl(34) synthesis GTPase MnmE [Bacilli bacterium]
MDDTICAIATSSGVGAISIIRVSGEESINIVNKIFKGKDLKKVATHTINYGHIVEKDNIIDEVLVSVMKAPKTFTTEDVVEINCHGGIATTKKVLELLLTNGCRLAERGEFTKRAYLNGRIDSNQAEAVMDLIDSKTEIQRKLAINSLEGKVSELINNLRNEMIQIIANINVNMDYPEYDDVEEITNEIMLPKIKSLREKIEKILKESNNGCIIKNGINTAIIGKPNVGKSSLLNALINEEKAIVTDIAGTTRDIVEGSININGIPLNIIDTAGIRETEDVIESIGVKKSLSIMENADLVLFILNNNEEIDDEIIKLYSKVQDKKNIIIVNKLDLETKIDYSKLPVDKKQVVNMSIKNKIGIEELKQKIIDLYDLEGLENNSLIFLTNARNIGILKTCLEKVNDVEESINNNIPIDMIEIDIKAIWEELGRINGTTYEEELLDEMFKRFCLGK